MTDTPRTDTDRDALAERFVYHCVDCMGDLGFASTDEWLDALIAEVRRQAHAPIKALADELERPHGPDSATAALARDLRAALDPAAVADHERDVQQQTLRDAATAVPLDCHDPRHMADWLRDRADALGDDRP